MANLLLQKRARFLRVPFKPWLENLAVLVGMICWVECALHPHTSCTAQKIAELWSPMLEAPFITPRGVFVSADFQGVPPPPTTYARTKATRKPQLALPTSKVQSHTDSDNGFMQSQAKQLTRDWESIPSYRFGSSQYIGDKKQRAPGFLFASN